jgi:hypothetical protein
MGKGAALESQSRLVSHFSPSFYRFSSVVQLSFSPYALRCSFVLLETMKEADYRSPQPEQFIRLPILRRLSTSHFTRTQLSNNATLRTVPSLEAPNIVGGVVAALASQLEVRQMDALVLISMQMNAALGSDSVGGFAPVLQAFDELRQNKRQTPGPEQYKETLKSIRPDRSSEMYL